MFNGFFSDVTDSSFISTCDVIYLPATVSRTQECENSQWQEFQNSNAQSYLKQVILIMSNIVRNVFHLICQAICGEDEWLTSSVDLQPLHIEFVA